MFDHRYDQTEKTHTHFLGDGFSMMSKDFTASPANIQILVEGLDEGSPSPTRQEANRTAFKNKGHRSSPSKASYKNHYLNPLPEEGKRVDTETSDRASMVNPHKLQQQEEPVLDSDDEGLLQPEMHQSSLKSAERINLFPAARSGLPEGAHYTLANAPLHSISLDVEQMNNQ